MMDASVFLISLWHKMNYAALSLVVLHRISISLSSLFIKSDSHSFWLKFQECPDSQMNANLY